jgi:lycopene elongase/hydratase (dihydrobisanhydrobacterioruberin-forming)
VNIKQKIFLLLKISRPVFWVVGPIIFLIGLKYSGEHLQIISALQMLFLAFPLSLFVFAINDLYDFKSDMINPRKKGFAKINLKNKQYDFITKNAILAGILVIISSVIALNFFNIISMLFLVFLTYYYSAPKLRLKERPPLDSISNGVMIFLIFALGFSFNGSFSAMPIELYLVCVGVMGFHAVTTTADYSSDKKAGQKTFAVRFGKRVALAFAIILSIIVFFLIDLRAIFRIFFLIYIGFILILFFFPKEKIVNILCQIIYVIFIVAAFLFIF